MTGKSKKKSLKLNIIAISLLVLSMLFAAGNLYERIKLESSNKRVDIILGSEEYQRIIDESKQENKRLDQSIQHKLETIREKIAIHAKFEIQIKNAKEEIQNIDTIEKEIQVLANDLQTIEKGNQKLAELTDKLERDKIQLKKRNAELTERVKILRKVNILTVRCHPY